MNIPSACTSLPYRLMPVSVNILHIPMERFHRFMWCAPIEAIWVVSHISHQAVSDGALALSLDCRFASRAYHPYPLGATDMALQWYSPPVFMAISSPHCYEFSGCDVEVKRELAMQMHPQAPVGVGPYGGDAVGGESAVAFTRAIAYVKFLPSKFDRPPMSTPISGRWNLYDSRYVVRR